jgi:hypothetical protein
MKIVKDTYGEDTLVLEKADDVLLMAETLQTLYERVVPVANKLLELEGIRPTWGPVEVDDIEIEAATGNIYANYSIKSMGEYENLTLSIPLEYLFDDSWIPQAEWEIAERDKQERIKKEAEEERRRLKKEEAEFKRYQQLRKKFENKE